MLGNCIHPDNNNIGKCTSDQVKNSDLRPTVAGTFVWSGFDYLGEARGWPQNTKCRGTVSDVAGFTKETAYWIRSVWLSNISKSDPGRPQDIPTNLGEDNGYTTDITRFAWDAGTPLPLAFHPDGTLYYSAANLDRAL